MDLIFFKMDLKYMDSDVDLRTNISATLFFYQKCDWKIVTHVNVVEWET